MREFAIDTLFLDRDGIINDVVMRGGKVSSPRTLDEFVLRAEFVEFYETIRPMKLNVFVVSNQPDVGRNLMSQSALDQMTSQLGPFEFTEVVYCLHDDFHGCLCRKPKPGMITGLLDKYGLKKDRALFVGDGQKDILAGKAAQVATAYLRTTYNDDLAGYAEFVVSNLSEITEILNTWQQGLIKY